MHSLALGVVDVRRNPLLIGLATKIFHGFSPSCTPIALPARVGVAGALTGCIPHALRF